jgi:hypothetical protein
MFVAGVLFEEAVRDFAERFSLLDEEENADVNEAFEAWCEIEDISSDLQNYLAQKNLCTLVRSELFFDWRCFFLSHQKEQAECRLFRVFFRFP